MSTEMLITNDAYRLQLNYSGIKPNGLSRLVCARNDTAAFQIILQNENRFSINLRKGEWFCEQRHTRHLRIEIISEFDSKAFIEGFLQDDDDTMKADALLLCEAKEFKANTPAAVWVELSIPENTPAGNYTVKIKQYASWDFEDEVLESEQVVTLCVKNYVMPYPANYNFYLDLWQHCSNIARKHDVQLWSDRHFEILDKYVASLADLGQKSTTVIASEIPWCGQGCADNKRNPSNLYEFSMISVLKEKDGSFSYDYSAMQRYIDLCKKHGINGDIEVFGLVNVLYTGYQDYKPCPDFPINIKYLDKADGCLKYMRDMEDIKGYITSLYKYFNRTRQISRVRIAADEPADIIVYKKSLKLLKSIAPRFRYKTAINHAEFIGDFHNRIDDFAPYINCAGKEYERIKEYQAMYSDKKFLWYVCCGGRHPNTFLGYNPLECRCIGLFTYLLGFDGFLRWNYTVWPDKPLEDIRYGNFEAGDTNFVYPSKGGDVIHSLRYKNLKRGIEDFELLKLLKNQGKDDIINSTLKKTLGTVKFDPEHWNECYKCSTDYDDYFISRELMLEALSAE